MGVEIPKSENCFDIFLILYFYKNSCFVNLVFSPDSSENPFIFSLKNKRLQRIAGLAPRKRNINLRPVRS
jgi:hypothetical protein